MLSRLLWIALLLSLCACTGQDVTGNRQVPPAHTAESAGIEQAITGYQQEQAILLRELGQANARVEELEATVDELELALAKVQSENNSLTQQTESVNKLRREVSRAKAGQQAAIEEVKQLQKSLQDMAETIDALSVSESASPQDGAPGIGPVEQHVEKELYVVDEGVEVEGATTVELFYATNRARLSHGIADYMKPLWPALALIVLYFAALLCIRTFIKSRFQSTAIIGVRAVSGIALIYFLISAAQTITQLRQTQQLNPVLYGNSRLEPAADQQPFELGTCKVSIPPIHRRSVVELPKITHFEFRYDPAKHFVLSDIEPSADTAFYEKLQQRVSLSDRRDLFVFVHGFHNTFQDAAFRTAQIAHDLQFPGAPIFFSWPSQGAVLDYAADENNVKIAVFDLQSFLEQLRERSGAQRIHLIAHSMGSRALSRAIAQMSVQQNGAPLFNEMILAAPDIDAQVLDRLSASIASAVDRITLYASSRDEALSASRFIHGQTYQRAGETIPLPLVNPHIDTIDVSEVTSGHSYIAGSGHILGDLRNILSNSRSLDEGIARKISVADGEYWIMK